MSKTNHIKLLTDDELKQFNEHYIVEYFHNNLIIKTKSYNRNILYPVDSTITLNSKIRKISITSEVINIWNKYYSKKYSIFDIVQAVNILKLFYMDVTKENVDIALKKYMNK